MCRRRANACAARGPCEHRLECLPVNRKRHSEESHERIEIRDRVRAFERRLDRPGERLPLPPRRHRSIRSSSGTGICWRLFGRPARSRPRSIPPAASPSSTRRSMTRSTPSTRPTSHTPSGSPACHDRRHKPPRRMPPLTMCSWPCTRSSRARSTRNCSNR